MIELRQFRQFVAVAEELNFRRAAQRLHMAQPPLTVAVRRIEDELGLVLIQRTNRIEGLTQAGQIFLAEARRTLVQANRAIDAAKRAGEGMTGSLRITFVASVAHDLLPRALRRFRTHHPEIQLSLDEATTAQQLLALREDRADVGFVVLPFVDATGLTVTSLRKDSLVAAVPNGHPLAARRALKLSDLARESWILFPARYGFGLHGRIMAACASAGFVPRVAQEAVQMETIVNLVAGGMGVALVAPAMATARRPGVAFRPITGPGSPIDYELALAFSQPSPVVDAFVSTAQAVARTKSRSAM
jgi:DNA-binding transcriptional LysR family regulator